jgi:hypothetical protein
VGAGDGARRRDSQTTSGEVMIGRGKPICSSGQVEE